MSGKCQLQRAFTAAYREHAAELRRFVTSIIIDHRLAEDVVQETFLELWLHPERWDPTLGDLCSWLRTIARRRAIDRIRSLEASRRREFRLGIRDLCNAANYADERDALFFRNHLRLALAALTNKQRDAIVLRYFEDLSVREVARELGINVCTAKTRVRDGLRALHRGLARHASGGVRLDDQ